MAPDQPPLPTPCNLPFHPAERHPDFDLDIRIGGRRQGRGHAAECGQSAEHLARWRGPSAGGGCELSRGYGLRQRDGQFGSFNEASFSHDESADQPNPAANTHITIVLISCSLRLHRQSSVVSATLARRPGETEGLRRVEKRDAPELERFAERAFTRCPGATQAGRRTRRSRRCSAHAEAGSHRFRTRHNFLLYCPF